MPRANLGNEGILSGTPSKQPYLVRVEPLDDVSVQLGLTTATKAVSDDAGSGEGTSPTR
jgi:hypothetical protein